MDDDEPAVLAGAPLPPGLSHRLRSLVVASPSSTARGPNEVRHRSAQVPDHHSRSCSVAKHQADADVFTSRKPAARDHASSLLPASGSPPLARAVAM